MASSGGGEGTGRPEPNEETKVGLQVGGQTSVIDSTSSPTINNNHSIDNNNAGNENRTSDGSNSESGNTIIGLPHSQGSWLGDNVPGGSSDPVGSFPSTAEYYYNPIVSQGSRLAPERNEVHEISSSNLHHGSLPSMEWRHSSAIHPSMSAYNQHQHQHHHILPPPALPHSSSSHPPPANPPPPPPPHAHLVHHLANSHHHHDQNHQHHHHHHHHHNNGGSTQVNQSMSMESCSSPPEGSRTLHDNCTSPNLVLQNSPLEASHFDGIPHHAHKHAFSYENVSFNSAQVNESGLHLNEPPIPVNSDSSLHMAGSIIQDSESTTVGVHGLRLKPHSTPATLCWLDKNYELSEGVCIPRNVVYFNYVDFCSKNHMQPVNAASFGKIIRQMFANLTTRRLGTRGQSRYHYYGLAVKPDSIYYSPNYSSRKHPEHQVDVKLYSKMVGKSGLHSPLHQNDLLGHSFGEFPAVHSGSLGSTGGHTSTTAPSSSLSSSPSPCFSTVQQLPEFPSFREFAHATSIPLDKLQTLITMYRAHCQRIMDSINKFSFSEIPHLFAHFWQEIPPHIADLLGQNVVVTLIGVCDAILYRTILKAILPTPVQMFPENVLKIIRKFADDVVGSLQYSLKQVPENLIYVKMKLVKQMSKMLKRRTSVNHLYQAACLLMNSSSLSIYIQMAQDWHKLDLKHIIDECGTKICAREEVQMLCQEFQQFIHDKSSIYQICLWSTSLIENHVKVTSMGESNVNNAYSISLIGKVRRFLIVWTSVSSKVLKHLKDSKPNGPSTSCFHLLQLLLNEYILHEIERHLCEDSMRELMMNLVNAQASELSDSSFIDSLGADFLSNPNLFHGSYEAPPTPPCIAHNFKDNKRCNLGSEGNRKMIKLERNCEFLEKQEMTEKVQTSYWHCETPTTIGYAENHSAH